MNDRLCRSYIARRLSRETSSFGLAVQGFSLAVFSGHHASVMSVLDVVV
jgi:hypothetical protein